MIVRTSVTHPTGPKKVVLEQKKEEVAPIIEKVETKVEPATLPVEENVEMIETPKRPRKERVKKVVEEESFEQLVEKVQE